MWFQRIFRPSGRRDKERIDRASNSEVLNQNRRLVYLPAQAIKQLDRLQLTASRYLPGRGAGIRPSLRRKAGADFREHRMYVPGDDVRFVDWRASARHEQIFVKQEEHPREITIYLLLDCSASMGWGEPSKRESALSIAAGLGYLALTHGDRLVIYPFTREVRQPLGPISGKGQVPTLLKFLHELPFSGRTDFKSSVAEFSQRVIQSGLTIVISDLFGVKDLSSTLDLLPVPTWDVILLHLLHPEELQPSVRGDFKMVDIETDEDVNYDVDDDALRVYQERLEAWRHDLDMTCVEHSAFYTLVRADWSLYREIIPHLRSVRVLTPI